MKVMEAHAALTQAVAAVGSVAIAAATLIYAVWTLKALQRQTEPSIAMTNETFRPIIEVLGTEQLAAICDMEFVNKGNGPALNFRWRDNILPERWRAYRANIISPHEKGVLKAGLEWHKGLILSYNSTANSDEILTYVTVDSLSGSITNHHMVKTRRCNYSPWMDDHWPEARYPCLPSRLHKIPTDPDSPETLVAAEAR